MDKKLMPGSSSKVITAKLMGCADRNPLMRESRITKYTSMCPLPCTSFHYRWSAEPHVLHRWVGG